MVVAAMEVVPFPGAQPAIMGSMILSAAWYMASTSVVASIPAIVEVAANGAEELVEEVMHGSKQVVRCVAMGAVVIAAIAVVQIGIWVTRLLGVCNPRVPSAT